jgi:predicted TIM-barrel fold metal-dependent hydrolase
MTRYRSSRRDFLRSTATAASVAPLLAARAEAAPSCGQARPPIVDTHMHVWSGDLQRFPFAHPYEPEFKPPAVAATVELLTEEMDRFGITHCVLVQTIYHGWDNRYLVECGKAHPRRFRGHGLVDPTDPRVAEKLDYWVREHGLAGMRFSPIYYKGRDDWLTSTAANALWKKAVERRAIFNFFIAAPQLPTLEVMVRRFPEVRVVIDHLARIALKGSDAAGDVQKLLALARHPNVWVKVSELGIISPSGKYPYVDTHPWLRRVYDTFGPERLLWGTGFPGATRAQAGRPSLEQELNLIRREIPFFTPADQEKILGTNAARLWAF